MEKIKFSNGCIYDILVNGVSSNAERVKIAMVVPYLDLVEVESMVSMIENTERLELLSETEEVLKIYTGYTILESIEKKKNVVITSAIDEESGETIDTTSDVIYITLRKHNETENRLTSLEETVDLLVVSALI